jgi:hypothetical protein
LAPVRTGVAAKVLVVSEALVTLLEACKDVAVSVPPSGFSDVELPLSAPLDSVTTVVLEPDAVALSVAPRDSVPVASTLSAPPKD